MPKVIDISDRLSCENIVLLKTGDEELEVKIDAETAIKSLGLSDQSMGAAQRYEEMKKILFTKESIKKIDEMKLSYPSYRTVIETAFSIAIGAYEDDEESTEGEQETLDTI